MIDCEICWTVLQKMQCRTSTNFLQNGKCLCFWHWRHLYSWERIIQKIHIPLRIQEQFQMFEHIWKVDNRTVNWWIQLNGVILHGNINLWLAMKKSSVSRAQRFTYSQILCMSWKGQSEPTIKCCLGGQVNVVQKFITTQNFGHNWSWANGIRVEYFPGFTTLQLCYKVQELLSRYWA